MRRTFGWILFWLLFGALFLAVGPWSLLVVLALLVPAVRRAARPRHPWWASALVLVVTAALVGAVVVIPDGRLPIPPGPGALVTPAYEGSPARPKPVTMDIAQHPFLAPNGRSSMHDDGWATDAYRGPGPLGRSPEVETAWYGLEECATLAFDAQERIVGLCGDLQGPVLHVLDPESMRPLATMRLPDRPEVKGKKPWENLCAGAYFYLDRADRAVVATTDRRILEVSTSGATGRPRLKVEHSFSVADEVPRDDCLVALMPDWAGRTWFVTQDGRVGTVDPDTGDVAVRDLGEEVANSLAVDEGGVYVVTVRALYRMRAGRHGQTDDPLAHDVRPREPDQARAAEPRAAGPPRPSCPAAGWRSPTTPTRGCTWLSTTPPPAGWSARRRSSRVGRAPPRTRWSRWATG